MNFFFRVLPLALGCLLLAATPAAAESKDSMISKCKTCTSGNSILLGALASYCALDNTCYPNKDCSGSDNCYGETHTVCVTLGSDCSTAVDNAHRLAAWAIALIAVAGCCCFVCVAVCIYFACVRQRNQTTVVVQSQQPGMYHEMGHVQQQPVVYPQQPVAYQQAPPPVQAYPAPAQGV